MRDHPIHQLIKAPCVIHHADPGAADPYGDRTVETETDSDELCYFTQWHVGENTGIEWERWHLFFLPSATIDANDSVTYNGIDFQVWGTPWRVLDPVTGYETHIEAIVEKRA